MTPKMIILFCSFFFNSAAEQTQCLTRIRQCRAKYEHGYCLELADKIFEIKLRTKTWRSSLETVK